MRHAIGILRDPRHRSASVLLHCARGHRGAQPQGVRVVHVALVVCGEPLCSKSCLHSFHTRPEFEEPDAVLQEETESSHY